MKRAARLMIAVAGALALILLGLTSAGANDVPGPGGSPHKLITAHNAQPAVLRPATPETVFVATAPCRAADTRVGGGPIASGSVRNFYIRGTAGFTGQGGHSGGCGVPLSASGVAANVTVTGAAANGYLVGFPFGTSAPLANFVTYRKSVTTTVNPTFALAASGVAPDLAIKSQGSSVQVVIDVSGYYVPQIEGMVAPDGSIYTGSSRLLSATHNSTGNYTVTLDSDVSYCTPTVTAYSGYVYASAYGFNSNKVQVFVWYLSSGTATAYDGYFYLKVDC